MELSLDFFQYIIVPTVAFFAGLLSKWFLQSQKARDDTLRSLASRRAECISSLWSLTTPFAIGSTDALDNEQRLAADKSFRKWYYEDGGALLLSWKGTKCYFLALDDLRNESSSKETLEKVFSRLRTQLKRDCGIYSWWNTWRNLRTPRAPMAG